MHAMPAAFQPCQSNTSALVDADELLPRHPIFRTRDLEHAKEHIEGVFGEHRVAYMPKERQLDFRHRVARLGPIAVNSMQYGAGVVVNAALGDLYLVQFTIAGGCELRQGRNSIHTPAGSVAVINPFRPFAKTWLPGTRQLIIRIDRRLVEREFRALTGYDETARIEFDPLPLESLARAGTLAHFARMLCDDLKNASSGVEHPLVRDRIASALVSTLLVSMPHNRQSTLEAAATSIAPFFVRRAEQFIKENAQNDIDLEKLAGTAGVSGRALQMGFRRFRNTSPMAYLRAVRLELARTELARAKRNGRSVTSIAHLCGFGHLGRFAADYQARFNESPSQTLLRGSVPALKTRD
jgi:AraC-like DNA-binding protein